MFNKGTFMPGTTENGYSFDARVDGALQTMYDKGDRNPVVFSHGGTIMFWTMMNVQNLSIMEKLQLLQTAQLDNTDYVVIEGNPEDGWTLVNWNGQLFAPEPTLGAEVKLQLRTLTRQLSAATKQIFDAFATGDIAKVVTAISRGVVDATYSVVKFSRAVSAKVVSELTPKPPVEAPEAPETSEAALSKSASIDSKSKTTSVEDTDGEDTGNVSTLRTRISDSNPTGTSNDDAVESIQEDDDASDTIDSSKDDADESDDTGSTDTEQGIGTEANADQNDGAPDTKPGTTVGGDAATTNTGDTGNDSGSQSAAA
jgi:hypothetical protein